jgi:Uncharacterized protein conserved in bacteria
MSFLSQIRFTISLSLCATGLLFAGCVNLTPKVDTYKLYSLGGSSASAAVELQAAAPIYVELPNLPLYMKGKQMVYVEANGQNKHLSRARWAEPMEEGLARGIAEQIMAATGRPAQYYPWLQPRSIDLLRVNFYRLELCSDGTLEVLADWSLRSAASDTVQSGRYQSLSLSWSTGDAESYIEALNTMLGDLATAIQTKLKSAE